MPAEAVVPRVTSMRQARMALLEVSLPGRAAEPAGVLLVDSTTDEARIRLRRDFHLIAEVEDLEVLAALEQDLAAKLDEMGGPAFLAWATESLSNAIRISDPEPVMVEDLDRAIMRLYRKYVPARVQRYETHLPLVALSAAAGSWGEAMSPTSPASAAPDSTEDWIEVPDDMRLDEQMFVARVVGRSMEPEIPDGSLCIFRYNPAGSRRGRRVLVENFSDASQRYTVKRYVSEKTYLDDGSFRHKRIVLEPLNPEFEPWELNEGEDVRVLGEFLRVLD